MPLKPESTKTSLKERLFGTAMLSGIPPGIDGHPLHRSVASTVTDQMLFAGSPKRMLVESQLAYVNGKRGLVMQYAEGEFTKITKEEPKTIKDDYYNTMLSHPINNVNKERINEIRLIIAVNLNCYPDFEWDGKTITYVEREFSGFDPNNLNTCEDLTWMQILDIPNGECDRHQGNYKQNIEGNTKGIDNESSFGVNSHPEGYSHNAPSYLGIIPNNGSLMLKHPKVVTKEMQVKVNKLLQNKEAYLANLAPYLASEEVKEAGNRLERLCEFINNPNKCLVV